MWSYHKVHNKNIFFKLATCIYYWKHSLNNPILLRHLASFMNLSHCFRPGMCIYSHLFMRQMKPTKQNILASAWKALSTTVRVVAKERKKCTILKSMSVLRTILNMIKLVCYLSSKYESFVLVFLFFWRKIVPTSYHHHYLYQFQLIKHTTTSSEVRSTLENIFT